jgi:hypothetical protein
MLHISLIINAQFTPKTGHELDVVCCGEWTVSDYSMHSRRRHGPRTTLTSCQPLLHALGDRICFFVNARALEPNIDSYLKNGGTDCTATNGCGLHVHSGDSCRDTDSQGGHYYNNNVADDPWLDIGYLYTSPVGNAYHADCVATGEKVYADHAFIVHAKNGSRVACDILSMPDSDYCDYYCCNHDDCYSGYGDRGNIKNEQWCHDCYDYVYYNSDDDDDDDKYE